MAYTAEVLDHFENPRNVGTLDKKADNVGHGLVGAPECGDVLSITMKFETDENGVERITDAKFKTFGCGSAIAASSLGTEMVKDASMEEALAIENGPICTALSLPPIKVHCSILVADGIHAAVQDYKKKKAKREAERNAGIANEQDDGIEVSAILNK